MIGIGCPPLRHRILKNDKRGNRHHKRDSLDMRILRTPSATPRQRLARPGTMSHHDHPRCTPQWRPTSAKPPASESRPHADLPERLPLRGFATVRLRHSRVDQGSASPRLQYRFSGHANAHERRTAAQRPPCRRLRNVDRRDPGPLLRAHSRGDRPSRALVHPRLHLGFPAPLPPWFLVCHDAAAAKACPIARYRPFDRLPSSSGSAGGPSPAPPPRILALVPSRVHGTPPRIAPCPISSGFRLQGPIGPHRDPRTVGGTLPCLPPWHAAPHWPRGAVPKGTSRAPVPARPRS